MISLAGQLSPILGNQHPAHVMIGCLNFPTQRAARVRVGELFPVSAIART